MDLPSSAIELEPLMPASRANHHNVRSDASSFEEETPLLFIDDQATSQPKVSLTTESSTPKQIQFDLTSPPMANSYRSFDLGANSRAKPMPKELKTSRSVVVTFDPLSESVQASVPSEQPLLCENNQSIL